MTTHLRRVLLLLLTSITLSAVALADGGMWLLEQMADQADELRAKGLQIPVEEIYNPDGPCLQRAVVMFDGGCSGVFVSNQGLVLTNHHCGYDQIQSHSAVEHNYLRDGIWTQSMREELPCPGLEVISIDKITNVTDQVNKLLKESPYKEDPMAAFSIATLTKMIPAIVGEEAMKQPGIRYELKPFYGGNRYYLFTKKVFTDVRLVAAPPSAIGKYGSDTDNWMWPRHTGDFSIFRVYVDKNNNPAEYSADNVPYKPERFAAVSTSGVQRDDFALIMGFPGTTNHFFTEAQVDEWSEIDNNIRIEMRGLRQEVMLRRMLADEKVNIQYAAKYAYSQNGYKRAQGANWAIRTRNLQATKRAQQDELEQWAKANNRPEVTKAIQTIADCVAARREARRVQWYLMEGILTPIEFLQIPLVDGKKIQQWSDPKVREEIISELRSGYAAFYNKDYDPTVDKEVATVLLQRYTERIDEAHWPEALREGVAQYHSVQAYVAHLFDSSIFADPARFEAFLKTPSREQLLNDPMMQFTVSTINLFVQMREQQAAYDDPIKLAHRDYVRGAMDMQGARKVWPDANLTLRFTYGNVRGYTPRDNVYYGHQTTLTGVMEKEDPNSWEFALPDQIKEIYKQKDYGVYALPNGEMPVNFCATTHTTGGNSGSPVFDSKGRLIGLNFDRNWEGVGGDIEYLPDYQRSIILDIRYLLMLVDKYGHCQRLLDEMNLVK